MTNVLCFIGCCLIWSSTWLFIKTGLEGFSPITFLTMRFAIAAPVLWVAARVARERLWPATGSEWRMLAFLGFGMFALPYALVYLGEDLLPSGLTAVLFALQPIFAVVFAHFLLTRERFRPGQLAGMLLGLAGVGLVCLSGLKGDAQWRGALALLGAAAVQGFMAVFVKRWGHRHGNYAGLGWANILGAAMLAVPALAAERHPVHRLTPLTLLSLLYLALIGSALAFVLFFRLIRTWEATKVSTISLVTPPLALLWGRIFLGESLGWSYGLGVALVIAGVWQANRARPRDRAPALAPSPASARTG